MAQVTDLFFSQLAVPAAVALDATGVKLRIPVCDTLEAYELQVKVVGATAPGTGLIVKVQGEPVAGGASVDLVTATCTAAVTQGKTMVRRFAADIQKSVYSFLVVNVTGAAAAGATGIVALKVKMGGSGAADANEVVVTS